MWHGLKFVNAHLIARLTDDNKWLSTRISTAYFAKRITAKHLFLAIGSFNLIMKVCVCVITLSRRELWLMKSAWNLIGMGLWLLLLIYLVWMVHDMRVRRLKLIVTEKKSFSAQNLTKSTIEMIIFLLGLWGMSYATFFQDVSKLNTNRVTVAYHYKPLVLDTTSAAQSTYVTVRTGKGRKPIQVYKYSTDGETDQVSSLDATISGGKDPINVSASAYKWNKKTVKRYDTKTQKAWVGVVETTYKKDFLNGIGLHAGRLANRFTLIRVPDHSFVKQTNLGADEQ